MFLFPFYLFQSKIRYTSYTGDKNTEENLAFLPSMILNITDGVPNLAHWTYRIICHPLTQHLNLSDIKAVDDISNRLARKVCSVSYRKNDCSTMLK